MIDPTILMLNNLCKTIQRYNETKQRHNLKTLYSQNHSDGLWHSIPFAPVPIGIGLCSATINSQQNMIKPFLFLTSGFRKDLHIAMHQFTFGCPFIKSIKRAMSTLKH